MRPSRSHVRSQPAGGAAQPEMVIRRLHRAGAAEVLDRDKRQVDVLHVEHVRGSDARVGRLEPSANAIRAPRSKHAAAGLGALHGSGLRATAQPSSHSPEATHACFTPPPPPPPLPPILH
eukprot:6160137-Prymnesium_polylepis.1